MASLTEKLYSMTTKGKKEAEEEQKKKAGAESNTTKSAGSLTEKLYSMTTKGMAEKSATPSAPARKDYYSPTEWWKDIDRYESEVTNARGAYDEARARLDNSQRALSGMERRYLADQSNEQAYSDYMAAVDAYKLAYEEYKPFEDKYNSAADAYNNYASGQQNAYDEWKSTIRSTADVQAEMDKLNEDIKRLTREKHAIAYTNNGEAYAAKEKEIAALKERYALLGEELNYSNYFNYSELVDNEDFEQYSKAGESKLGANLWQRLGDSETEKAYDYVNNINGYRDNMDEVDDAIGSSASTRFDILRHMTEDEISNFNYIYNTQGEKAAEQYLEWLTESLNYKRGQEIAAGMTNDFQRVAYGLKAGMNQFGSGMKQLVTDERVPTSAVQYANEAGKQELGKVGQFLNEAAVVTGNMAPSVLASAVLGPAGLGMSAGVAGAVGSVALGASAGGNAYAQALAEGKTKYEAKTYGTLVGAAEGGLQYLLGGIGSLGGVANTKLLAKVSAIDNALGRIAATGAIKIGSEITEEELQNFIEPALRSIIFDEKYDAPNAEELIHTALLTALTTGLMESGSIITAGHNNSVTSGLTENAEGFDFSKADKETIESVIEEGLASAENTEAHQLALELQKMQEKGETISAHKLGTLYNANVQAIEAENKAQKKADKNGFTAEQQAASEITGYGKNGTEMYTSLVQNEGMSLEEARKSMQTAYELGFTNKLGYASEQLTGIQKQAYNAGKQDAILNLAERQKKNPTVRLDSGFDMTNAPADITTEEKAFAELLSKAYAVKGVWGESTASEAFDGKLNGNGIVTLAKDFGISEEKLREIGGAKHLNQIANIAKERNKSMTFLLAHEITVHRMMELAPEEGLAFVNAMYQAQSKGRPAEAGTLAQAQRESYGKKGNNISVALAIEEISADNIIDMYGGEVSYRNAMERILNGTDEKAKSGARTFIGLLKDTVAKLKNLLGRLTGKANVQARDEVRTAIRDNERLIQLFEDAQKAALKNVQAQQKKAQNAKNAPQTRSETESVKFSTKDEVLALEGVDWMDNFSSIKAQLQKHADTINAMEPVAVADYAPKSASKLSSVIMDEITKLGGKNIKRGSVTFEFEQKGVASILAHAKTVELQAAALTSPYVAKYGKLIAGQKNHENTGLTTLTYAAPVIINDTTVNVGVVIQFKTNGKPRAVNVGLQDGGAFKIDTKKAPKGLDSRISRYGQGTALPTMDAYEDKVAQETESVKPLYSMKNPEDTETAVNQSMTMQQAKDMVQRAFVLGNIKEWFEDEYRNGDEWLKGEGVDAVAVVIDNEWALQEKYLNKIQGLMDEEFYTTDILEAYLAGTLTGAQKQDAKPKRLNTSEKVNALDERFYAPKQIENAKAAYETACQKVTNKNREVINKARAQVIMFAHTRGAAEALGLTQSELNKKLSSWARYTAKARETSQRFNAGVADWNKWTGIENSNLLTRSTVSTEDLDRLVGEITGDSDGWQRKYIMRTMLALDTHIDYSGLNFEFVRQPDSNRSSVNGIYSDSQRKIRVKYNAPNTVAHEMGHYLDYQWARDIGVSGAMTDGRGRNHLEDADVKQWAENFDKFKDSLTDAADLHSSYTMDAMEVFARFVDKFVRWVNFTANGEQSQSYYGDRFDRFTAQHYIEFVRLLQEKSVIDGKKQQETRYSLKDLDEIKAKYKDETDYLFLHEKGDTISVDNIVVKKEYRNKGIGTKILKDVIAYADETEKTITLTPTSEFGTKARLTKWYKAHGFVENKGRNADYRLSDTMYRLPRSGTKFSLKDQHDLVKENERLKEVNEALRAQFKEATAALRAEYRAEFKPSESAKVEKKALTKFAKQLLKDYHSTADINETRDNLDTLYTYIANGDEMGTASWDVAYRMAYDTAKEILESAVMVNDEMAQNYSDLRHYLRTTGLSLNKADEHDLAGYESLSEFRKANFGRIKITKDGLPVDTAYQELASRYPEFFNEEEYSNPADQLSHIEEVLNDLEPFEYNPYDRTMREATTWLANDIMERFYELPEAHTFADKAERKLTEQKVRDGLKYEELRTQKNERIKEIIKTERKRASERVAKEKAAKWEKVKETKEHYRAKEAKMSENRKARVLRERIMRHVKDLDTKLRKPTDKQHIPHELQPVVLKLLESINLESNYTYDPKTHSYKKSDDGLPTSRTEAFTELQKVYAEMAGELTIDPDLMGADGLLSEVIAMANKRIVDMNSTELFTVYQTIRAIEATVSTANKVFAESRWASIHEAAEALRADNEGKKDKTEYKKALGTLQELTGIEMETPETFFHMLGNAGDNIFRMMRNAQDEHIRLMKEISDFTTSELKEAKVRKLEAKLHEVTLGGEKVKLSTAQLMELYVLTQREQALDHIFLGGILPDVVDTKGIKRISKAKPVRNVTFGEVSEAIGKLSDAEVEMAKKLQKYASTRLSEMGNDASMKVYGYEKFGEKNYWPIRVNRQETKSDIQQDTAVVTLANRGFTKGTKPHAKNSVKLGSIFDTFATHSSEMATYAAWLGTLEDINRIRNYTFRNENRETVDTVKGIIDTVHGRNGSGYLEKLLADVTNGVKGTHSETDYMSGMIGNFKAAAVGANLRVIIQQPTSILRALDMIGAKDLLGIGNPISGWNKAKKYAPIAQWKDWGYFDINTGRQMKDVLFNSDTALDKVKNATMWGAGAADSIAWGHLWNACESEIEAKRKDLEADTEEFYKAVAERFTEIVDHTQVVDGILQRSQLMRTDDTGKKMATAFMGEPTKQYNMMMQAAYDLSTAKKGARKSAAGHFVRTGMTLAIAGVFNAAMQSIMDAVRDDDDEEKYWEKWLEAFKGNAVDVFNPAAYVPFVKDIFSIIQGYDVERTDMAIFKDAIDAAKTLMKALNSEGKNSIQGATINFIAALASFAGIPASNLKREIHSFTMQYAIQSKNYMMQYEMGKFWYNMSGNKTMFMDVLYNAYVNDKEAHKLIYNDLIKKDMLKTEDKSTAEVIASAMESRMKKAQGVSEVSELEQRYLSPTQQVDYDKSLSSVKNSSLWKKANAKQRDAVEEAMYNLSVGNNAGKELEAKIDEAASYGMSETEYLLYQLALDIYDKPNEKGKLGGAPTNEEKADAIGAMGNLSNAEIAFLWDTDKGYEALAAGVDMGAYVDYIGDGNSVNLDKLIGAQEYDIETESYFDFLDMLDKYDQPSKNGKLGTFTQDEAIAAINAMSGLTREQKAYLYQSVNSGWKYNPYK